MLRLDIKQFACYNSVIIMKRGEPMTREQLHEYLISYDELEIIYRKQYQEYLLSGSQPRIRGGSDRVNSMDYYKTDVAVQKHTRYDPVCKLHAHTFLEIMYMYHGSGVNNVEGVSILMEEGGFCILPPGVYHYFIPDGESVLMNILIQVEYLEQLAETVLTGNDRFSEFIRAVINEDRYSKFLCAKTGDELSLLADHLLIAKIEKRPYMDIETKCWLSLLFTRFTESDVWLSEGLYSRGERIADILNYIQAHYTDVDLTATAARFCYTKSTICRLIKKHTGKTFSEYLCFARLNHACILLRDSELSVAEIAARVGFGSVEYFNRRFKATYQTSPSHWREHNTEKAHVASM